MPKPIFTDATAIQFTIHCDVEQIDEPGFKDDLKALVGEIESMRQEDGTPLFTSVFNTFGSIDMHLANEMPLRDVRILHNRIEKMMQDMRTRQPAT